MNVCGCRHVALSRACAVVLNFVSFMCGKGLRSERERKCRMVEEHKKITLMTWNNFSEPIQ